MNPWQEVGSGSASGGGISNNPGPSNFPSIAVGPDGVPYVVWNDKTSGEDQIYVRRWNGSVWEEVGLGSASGYGISLGIGSSTSPSIVIAPNGKPYVAWDQSDLSGVIRDIYVRRWNGSSWEEAGLGSASEGGISETRSGYTPAIAAGIDGIVYAAWSNFDPIGFTEIYVRQYSE